MVRTIIIFRTIALIIEFGFHCLADKVSVATSRLKMLRILEDPEQTRKFVNQAREQHSAENGELFVAHMGIKDLRIIFM